MVSCEWGVVAWTPWVHSVPRSSCVWRLRARKVWLGESAGGRMARPGPVRSVLFAPRPWGLVDHSLWPQEELLFRRVAEEARGGPHPWILFFSGNALAAHPLPA